jgi:hypothetical protein
LAQLSGVGNPAERRLQLLRQSQQLREELAADVENLRPVVGWVERGYSVALSVLSVWPLVGGLTGFFMARKKGSLLSKATKVWSFWRLGKKMLGIFRRFSSGSPPPRQDLD